ncbi:Inhibitor of the KinA pathway to sporulation, predicted exonuclease [Actinacidiphila yanglinensis]|uniref:Inhibitor of the KinA pathway to sporulation, predicted exonuclease n=1 Tax=Actinacidiphila yanglinensis TaxID=310779 RepID=A0A1H5TB66_9ACTN|nr:3'-5' exonuclease [Actinacidiphila yanglinensis]SEF60040.1 Inhibitor of the KinA pathway to sporulation, predicted exonuclease [Actinacidiphila yanglinensis]
MGSDSALLNVIDVEATCWEGQPPPGSVHEIIEIGLTVVDLTARRRVARHRIPVRPVRSAVSAFCTALTGLTQAEVTRGVPFAEACRLLVEEHAAKQRPWASWGAYDRKQFARQSEAGGLPYPFGHPTEGPNSTHTNAKAVFTAAHGLRRRPGMSDALRIAGLPLAGRPHSGADDARNIAALVLDLVDRGAWPAAAG